MYLAFLEDKKTVINKSSIDLIKAIPSNIKYIIKVDFDRHVKVGINEGDMYTYTAVSIDGEYQPIEISNFIIVDLGTDIFGKYASERDTIIKEKISGDCRSFHSVGDFSACMRHTIIPLIDSLENAGSWEVFDKFKELEELRKENNRLKNKVQDLETRLNSILSEGQ